MFKDIIVKFQFKNGYKVCTISPKGLYGHMNITYISTSNLLKDIKKQVNTSFIF